MEDRQRAILIAMYVDLGLDVVRSMRVSGNLQTQGVKAHAVVVSHGAFETLAQDIAPVVAQHAIY